MKLSNDLEKVYEKYFEITAKFYHKDLDSEDFFDIVEEVENLLGFELNDKAIESFSKIGK
jgi:acyl carrier protein